MKKLLIFLLIMFISLFLWAQDDTDNFISDIQEPESIGSMGSMGDDEEPDEPVPFRLKNRTIELSMANIYVDVSNNFIAAADIIKNPFYMLWNIKDIKQDPALIYKDNILINIDDFLNGFKFNLDAVIKPFSIAFNRNDEWGFGLDIGHINAMGNIFISGNMLHLENVENEKFGVGAGVFAEAGIPVFFHTNEFKVKIRPAVYLPILYIEPNVIYNKRDKGDGSYIEAVYNTRVYSLVDINEDTMQNLQDEARGISPDNLGYDFGLSIEYPWDYDLDVGVNIVNIPVPFAAAKLYYYSQVTGIAFFDTSDTDLANLSSEDQGLKDAMDEAWYYEYETSHGYDSDGKKIYRPFSMLFYLNYRPYDSATLSLIPSLGFSLNWMYANVFSFEGGLSARFDFANIFIPVLGINYNDRKWKNSIDLVFNFRVIEFDFGLSLQSQDFVKSFQGAGLGVNFGIKLGW